ncbi:MAG: bacteriophage Gp15 family protein [Defluviitaleaceae bacterium]|nr:bacteriophage Gp15 family protein [Defluviitaleaceae bacterium]
MCSGDVYYDLDFDRDAIEASFAKQYGIRLSREEISVGEFLRLLSGLMPDTPLGRLVAVRGGAFVSSNLTSDERRVRSQWAKFRSKRSDVLELQEALAMMFG